MSESERDLDGLFREVQYGCTVVKLTAGLVAFTALLVCFGHAPHVSADAVLQPAGTILSHIFALVDRSLGIAA